MGNLFGQAQSRTAMAASQQASANDLYALQAQNQQNARMLQQQSQMNSLVAARTSALTSELGPAVSQPYALNGLPTIATSELGDQSTAQTSRNRLLGN